ncbi:hypothetical protein GCM10020254_33400 [Streptomyces goshikiensis]
MRDLAGLPVLARRGHAVRGGGDDVAVGGLSTTLAVHQCSPPAMSTPTVGKGRAATPSESAGTWRTATATTVATPAAAAA